MLYRYLWTEGKLHLSLGRSTIQHDDLMFSVIQELGHHPQNFVGGDYVPDDISLISRKWEKGITPNDDEISYLIEHELDNGRDQEIREDVATLISEANYLGATVEDTEPENNFGFMKEPHDALYPAAFRGGNKIPKEVGERLKRHVLESIETEYKDADEWIYFTVYGSGISYNWDEEGDFDIQMWVDYSLFQDNDTPVTADDLLADVRRLTQLVNFPTFADLDLETDDCEGKMLIQYYPKLGTGSREENLASQPYACYDLETNEWLYHPKPLTPKFYGEAFLLVMPKAQDIAVQAESLIDELHRETIDWSFWYTMAQKYGEKEYKAQYEEARRKAEEFREAVHNLFQGVFQGRAEAYSPEGKGIEDERDAVQKLLEVWGIFQKLKHDGRAKLPWEEQKIPKNESSWKFAMAADPAFIQNWIADYGPYLYHGSREGHDPQRIAVQGLLPGQRVHNENPGTLEEYAERYKDEGDADDLYGAWDDEVESWWHTPRPGHVFMAVNPDEAYGTNLWRVDLRKLDPQNLNPDEDLLRDQGPEELAYKDPTRPTLGEQAEQMGWGDNPQDTHDSFDYGSIAHRGTIPPEAIEHVATRPKGTYEWQWHTEKTSSMTRRSDWNDIMDKARRYMQEGRIQMNLNTPTHAVATVQGDTGTYQTEIWRDDPNSDAITLWNCTCPWGEVSWGRTRKWKKYEGRPCAHATAVQWVSRSGTFPIQQEPGQQEQLNLPGMSPYTPVGPIDPSQLPEPPQQRNLAEPVPVPGGPNMLDQAQQDQQAQQAPPAPPPPPAPIVPPPPKLPPSRLTQPGEGGQLTLPGTFTHWKRTSVEDWIKESWFDNGDLVRTKQPIWGQDARGTDYIVPKGMKGEVLWSDAEETVAIFSINSGPLGPFNVKVTDDTDLFYIDPRSRK